MCDFKVEGLLKTIRDLKGSSKSAASITKGDVMKVLSLERVNLINRTNIYPSYSDPDQAEQFSIGDLGSER
jgi:hypothetical protein